jgi:single-strand DNA-binding protein
MARDNTITISGNMTRPAELKYTQGGVAYAKFGLAWNPPGRPNGNGGFTEEPPHFFDVTCWADLAEHVAELDKGTRVTVVGNLEYQTWDKDGEKRSKVEIRADEVGPSLRWATADVTRAERNGGGGGGGSAKRPADPNEEPFVLTDPADARWV